jgi:hypothetical protein
MSHLAGRAHLTGEERRTGAVDSMSPHTALFQNPPPHPHDDINRTYK